MEERRAAPRYRVLKSGQLKFGNSSLECRIRNVSATGARIAVRNSNLIPNEFELVMVSDNISRHSHIVWRRDDQIGLAFDD